MEAPEVRYTSSSDVAIAYYVVGEGPPDLVFVPFTVSTVFAWHLAVFRDFCLRLSSFSRLILFDKRGIGASDRPRTAPTLESQMEDVRAVLDAVGSEQTALFGSGHGGQMCALFAATYPERTTALVLYGTRHRAPGGTVYVVGLRSIGTTLSASVAATASSRRRAALAAQSQ